jgi:hypothetical protein
LGYPRIGYFVFRSLCNAAFAAVAAWPFLQKDADLKRLLTLATALCGGLALSGCATPITPAPTGGNRAGGTVDMSFEYSNFQRPVINWDQAKLTAKQRCIAWGYSDADPFGGTRTQCVYANVYGGCVRQTVTMTYQCTGNIPTR